MSEHVTCEWPGGDTTGFQFCLSRCSDQWSMRTQIDISQPGEETIHRPPGIVSIFPSPHGICGMICSTFCHSVFLCIFLSVSSPPPLSLSPFICFFLFLYVSLFLSLFVSLSLSLPLSLSPLSLFVFLFVSLPLSLSLSLSLSPSFFVFLPLSLYLSLSLYFPL